MVIKVSTSLIKTGAFSPRSSSECKVTPVLVRFTQCRPALSQKPPLGSLNTGRGSQSQAQFGREGRVGGEGVGGEKDVRTHIPRDSPTRTYNAGNPISLQRPSPAHPALPDGHFEGRSRPRVGVFKPLALARNQTLIRLLSDAALIPVRGREGGGTSELQGSWPARS